MVLGVLIPEFPGQTHVWIWREIAQLRRWGVPLRLFSTRPPPERDRARHAFADGARAETTYLWPMGAGRALSAVAWAALRHPVGLLRCIGLALTLPTTDRRRVLRLLGLIVPACELARRCRAAGVEHLHTHSCAASAVLCMMVKRLLGTPYSMTLNANIDWWGGAMEEKFGEAEFTNPITQWLLDQMRRDYPGLRPAQAVLGRIGVDTDLWVPRPRPPRGAGRLQLACVARLHHTKAQDVLLEALAILVREGHDLGLRIVGDGPARPELEAQARRLGLEERVTFTGSLGQEQIMDLMADSDVFALPSRFEPLGVAYMEAMSMELPTIGTTAGGVHEIIDAGEDGLLVPPDDAAALAEAIRTLVRDPGLRERMGKAGRRKVVERYDSRVGAGMLYQRLFGEAPPTGGPSSPAVAVAAGG